MYSDTKAGLGIFGIVMTFLVLNVLLGGWCTQYTVEFWGTLIQHHIVHVPFFAACIAALFLGQFFVPLAIVTWILSFVL